MSKHRGSKSELLHSVEPFSNALGAGMRISVSAKPEDFHCLYTEARLQAGWEPHGFSTNETKDEILAIVFS